MTPEQRQLAAEHLPLVRFVLRKRFHRYRWLWDDLEGHGYIGLCEAAVRFDPSRGYQFSTLACSQIAGAVLVALRLLVRDASRYVRLGAFGVGADADGVPMRGRPVPPSQGGRCLSCGREITHERGARYVCLACDRARHRAKSRFGGEGVCVRCAQVIRSKRRQPTCFCPEGPALKFEEVAG